MKDISSKKATEKPAPQTIIMTRSKECKHSVVFSNTDEKAFTQSVYVRRSNIPEGATEIIVTMEVK